MTTGPKIIIARKSGAAALAARIAGLTKLAAYVGVPAEGTARRSEQLLQMADRKTGKKAARLKKAAAQAVTNAELLFIHSKGSPLKHIPARPVLEPSVQADGNRQAIASELAQSKRAELQGDREAAVKRMRRASLAGQNAARGWFTDSRNAWAPNKPATIRRKSSDKPLIDTGALRASIVGLVAEE